MTAGFLVTAGWDVPVGNQSQVHAAVTVAEAAAAHAQLAPAERAACSLIATELATNLARHACDGRLMTTATDPGPCSWVQLVAVDAGPGIADVDAALADGYSTANSLGGGLGACHRAAGAFDLYGAPGAGTVVVARVGPGSRAGGRGTGQGSGPGGDGAPGEVPGEVPGAAPGPVPVPVPGARIGGILCARPGERESGDGWGAWWDADVLTVAIMDGLGHGPEAARAAQTALGAAADDTGADPGALLTELNRRLSGGRGAVGAVARLEHGKLAFGGVGNIGARLSGPGRPQGLVSTMGTLGLGQRLRPGTATLAWGGQSVFSAHSDGLKATWDLSRYPGLGRRDPAVLAALIWRDAVTRTDDASIVLVVPEAGEARS